MLFHGVKLFNVENIKKIKMKEHEWEFLIADKDVLFKALGDLLLSEENLFYYVTHKESTKTLEETKKFVRKLIDKNIIDSDIKYIMKTIGWADEEIDINNTVFQGDLAEYLMCIFVDQITNLDTIISKTAFKTSPKMPSFGNDNIFYDYDKEILYYGEAKFYNNITSAMNKAQKSIDKHAGDLEFSFIKTHTGDFIAKDGIKRGEVVEKIETRNIEEITIKFVSFIVNDDIYKKNDYETAIIKKFGKIDKIAADGLVMIFLPILDKKEFLEYFKKRLTSNE